METISEMRDPRPDPQNLRFSPGPVHGGGRLGFQSFIFRIGNPEILFSTFSENIAWGPGAIATRPNFTHAILGIRKVYGFLGFVFY